MSKFISRGLYLVLFTGGLTLLGAGIANAADTTGDDGLLSGTQIVAPITAPVEVAGNAVSVLGDVLAAPAPAPAPVPAPAPAPAPAAPVTSGTDSVLGGTQAVVDATAPVAVQGNAISVLGDSAATPAAAPVVPVAEPTPPESAASTSGSDGIASGTQILPDITVPVTVGGNAISLLGDSSSTSTGAASAPAAGSTGSSDATTSGSEGVASGSQVVPNVALPVTVGGNAISLLGDSSSTGSASVPAGTSSASTEGASTTGDDGIAGGTQVLPNLAVPVTVGGNAISLLGDSSSTGSASAPAGTSSASTEGASTTGDDGIAGGTQVAPDVAAPVTVGGNAISILGDAASTGSATSSEQEGTSDDVTTTGNDGILGGTQIVPSISLPITIGANAISVLGDTTAGDPTVGDDDGTSSVDGFPGDLDPAVPTDPVLTAAVTTGTTVAFGAGNGTTRTAALNVQALASTGAEIAPLLGLVAVLLIAGLGLAFAGRRRTHQ